MFWGFHEKRNKTELKQSAPLVFVCKNFILSFYPYVLESAVNDLFSELCIIDFFKVNYGMFLRR